MNEEPVNEPKVIRGFIGWADILGYKSVALKTSSQAAAQVVFDVIESVKPEVVSFIENHYIEDNPDLTAIHPHAEWFLFSDTIVFFIPEDPLEASEEIVVSDCASYAAVAMELLYTHMFDAGLPLRGTLHFGEFYRSGISFAGKGVMEAAVICDKMEMSGIIVTGQVADWIRYFPNGSSRIDGTYLVHHKVPFKSEEILEEDKKSRITIVKKGYDVRGYFLLNDHNAFTLSEVDIEKRVKDAFSGHGKSISSLSVQIKIQNTIDFLEGIKAGTIKPLPPQDRPDGFSDF